MKIGNSRKGNVLLIFLSFLLCLGLGAFLVWNHREEQETIQKIQSEAGIQQEENNQTEQADNEESKGEKTVTDEKTVKDEDTSDAQYGETENAEENSQQISGISIRGDAFVSEDEIEEAGIGKYLSDLLAEQGSTLDVAEYTMDKAGSISQMKRAGVSQTELDAYVTRHKENSGEGNLSITEVKIRDLTEEDMARIDQNYLPVICIGYYGGWGNDLDELCEQQRKILETYSQQEKYLILGVYPNGCKDHTAYTSKMEGTWGEHYLQLDGVLTNSISTDKGKKEAAQRIYDKLVELGYLA